ncbi:MAG: hypothetical protein H6R26_242 [Proteobacteria bacterium]|nr:hypothetical protein [Pseudomonadota bacterium]
MNCLRTTLAALFSLFLTLSAVPAEAVSFNSTFSASRSNNIGSTFVNMTNRNTTFCYLSRVGFANTDTDGEFATCRVTRGTVVWTLEALLDENNDADARCSAICYNN